MNRIARWRVWARSMKREIAALSLALADPRTPRLAKAVAFCVVAYALSPIDLIPDPIPLLGYLDDLVLLPLGIALVRRLIPPDVLADCRRAARHNPTRSPILPWIGLAIIATLWLAALAAAAWYAWRYWRSPA